MNNIPEKIGPFSFDKSASTMKYGFYYKALLGVPFSEEKRAIRVWLPEDYDFNKPEKVFPTIYFSDGQNLVNQKLCAFGCWKLDIIAHELLINRGLSFIAVGIDSPKDSLVRFNELNPPYIPERVKEGHPYGDQFVNYIADILIPLINKYFFTSKNKKDTAIGGSSMGGIMAFYAGATRHDTFGFALNFSPAFFLYYKKTWSSLLDSFNISPNHQVKHFFYVGGKDFEKRFLNPTKETYRYLKKKGFAEKQTTLSIDLKEIHHEHAWHKHLKEALLFWLDK